MNSIVFQYPSWMILLCLIAGASYSLILYFRETQFTEQNQKRNWWIYLIAVIRGLVVSFIAVLLLSPLLKLFHSETEKPIIVLAQDNSSSVRMHFRQNDSADYVRKFSDLKSSLEKKYTVKTYLVGSSIRENFIADFKDGSTNLSDFFTQLQNIYANQNLGAVILASDGAYNEGSNPVYSSGEKMAPVFTLAIGDTTVKRDLLFSKMYFNRVAYLGNSFVIRGDVMAQNCKGENVKLQVFRIEDAGERLLHEKNISCNSDFVVEPSEFAFAAEKAGISHYRFVLNHLDSEVTYANNVQDVFVEVLEVKEKILLFANSPHPDVAALKQAIESNKNYKLDIVYAQGNNADVKDYSLVIFHQLPTGSQTAQGILSQCALQKKSILFFSGAQTSVSLFNSSQDALKINRGNNSMTEATAAPQQDFTLFNLSLNVQQALSSFPPLKIPFGEYQSSPGASVLAYQKIGNVTTRYPLISFYQSLNSKIGIICGEGIWRWRNYDFLQHNNGEFFNELITRMVQYLCVKPDDKQFSVSTENSRRSGNEKMFSENEPVIFSGQLFNDTREPINSPDVNLIVRDASGKEFNYTMNRNGSAYLLNAGSFVSGNYSYTASVLFNGKNLSDKGVFIISPLQLENTTTRADFQLLNLLSNKSGGKMFYANQMSDLLKAIEEKEDIKPVIYSTQKTESVINLKLLFFLFAGLLSLEWFIRKFNGGY